MKNNVTTNVYVSSGGKSLFVLFVVLLVLKLAEITTMSWWLVTLPLWIVFVIFAVIFVGAFICIFIDALLTERRNKKIRASVAKKAAKGEF